MKQQSTARRPETYRVVLIHDSGHREVHETGLALAEASRMAEAIEAQPHTTSIDVRVEEEE